MNPRLTNEALTKTHGMTPRISWHLLQGVEKDHLHKLLGEHLGEDPTGPVVDTARMNLIGGLRSYGYEVRGGRGGGSFYQVVNWTEPPTFRTAEDWPDEARAAIDWFHSLETVNWFDFTSALSQQSLYEENENPYHERSWLYLDCYECARDEGRLYSGRSGDAVVIRRFPNMPRFRIFNLTMRDSKEIQSLIARLSPGSLTGVRVLNVLPRMSTELEQLDKGSTMSRREAVYNVARIANHPEEFFNKRAMTTLRKLEREVEWRRLTAEDEGQMNEIVKQWRAVNEKKQRQLAITRDLKAIRAMEHRAGFVAPVEWEEMSPTFIGYRDGHPVTMHILDRIYATTPGERWAAQIVEKSLNYREQPGGAYGMADFNLVMTCRALHEMGYSYINAGGFDGGGWGLPQHKERFHDDRFEVNSLTYYSPQPHLERGEIRDD